MRSKEEIERAKKMYEEMCEKEQPQTQAEKNGIALLAAVSCNKRALFFDDFSEIIPRPLSYSAPYFGGECFIDDTDKEAEAFKILEENINKTAARIHQQTLDAVKRMGEDSK